MIGFRSWMLDGYKLMSGAGEWRMGVNTAECKRELFEGYMPSQGPATHEAPEHTCTCGLYAWYDWTYFALHSMAGPRVYGAVTAWGHIEAQRQGFRAQHAEPVVLAYHEEQPYRHVRDLKAIASEMGVACVPVEEMAEEALKHGQPVPREMIPEPAGLPLPSSVVSPGLVWSGSAGAPPMGIVTTGGFVAPPPPPPPPPPPRRKPPRGVRGATAFNVSMALVNLALGLTWGGWWNDAAAGLCALLAACTFRTCRRWPGR